VRAPGKRGDHGGDAGDRGGEPTVPPDSPAPRRRQRRYRVTGQPPDGDRVRGEYDLRDEERTGHRDHADRVSQPPPPRTGVHGAQQHQGRHADQAHHQPVGPGLLGVPGSAGQQGEQHAAEHSCGGAEEPATDQHGQAGGDRHGDHRRHPQRDRRAAEDPGPVVHEQAVRQEHEVHIAHQVSQLGQRHGGGDPGGVFVIPELPATRQITGQAEGEDRDRPGRRQGGAIAPDGQPRCRLRLGPVPDRHGGHHSPRRHGVVSRSRARQVDRLATSARSSLGRDQIGYTVADRRRLRVEVSEGLHRVGRPAPACVGERPGKVLGTPGELPLHSVVPVARR
jgi:hypothetical protein